MACIVGLVAAMSVQGLANLSAQRAIVGEYSDVQLEEMLEWINANVPPTGVFAGTVRATSVADPGCLSPDLGFFHPGPGSKRFL